MAEITSQLQHSVELSGPTGRLRLVPPAPAHDAFVAFLRTHPETRKYLSFFPGPDKFGLEEAKKRRESRRDDKNIFDWIILMKNKEGEEVEAGSMACFNIIRTDAKDECEIGILVSPNIHRSGIATEGLYTLCKHIFEDLKIHKVLFDTRVDNVGMRGWLDKAGAQLEGTFRQCWKDNGKWSDAVRYSILQEEWTEVVKPALEGKINRAK
ncbi:acyl-CoA N-acyltransferase [Flagelloscypha sp. PMI_526]|nr:acyl-CoA N-acyltransferase [Flagelloscypha sp. PMI_526]